MIDDDGSTVSKFPTTKETSVLHYISFNSMAVACNLRVLPLELLEDLVPQKCFLPHQFFAENRGFHPGVWARCMLSCGGHRVCQLFARDIPTNYCYLDKSVCCTALDTIVFGEDRDIAGNSVLQQLQLLQATEAAVFSVEICLILLPSIFDKASNVQPERLVTALQHLLQPLHLTSRSLVRTNELVQMGIACVQVEVVEPVYDDHTTLMLSDETTLLLKDVQLIKAVAKPPSIVTTTSFQQALEELQSVVARKAQNRSLRQPCKNLLLVGAPGSGKSTLAAAFLNANDCNCWHITATNVLGQFPGESEAKLRRVFAAARLLEQHLKPRSPIVLLLEDLHLLCGGSFKSGAAAEEVANSQRVYAQLLMLVDELYINGSAIICLAITSAPEQLGNALRRPGRFEHEIVIATPSKNQRLKLFTHFWAAQQGSENAVSLTEEQEQLIADRTQGYNVADLQLLAHTVSQMLLQQNVFDIDLTSALTETLQKSSPRTETDISVIRTKDGFESIGGMQKLKLSLEVSVLAGLQQQAVFQRFGLSIPKGILLYGPPGCAKTTFAKCLAAEAKMTIIAVSGAEVYSPYVGCAERFVAKIFDTARKNAPCLIFLDEIDTLVGRRALDSNVASSRSEVQLRILSTLLTEMDGIVTSSNNSSDQHILVLAATNRPDMLDDALLRPGRFDRLVHVPAPDIESRHAILELHGQRMPFADDIDLEVIAERTVNYSGADLCNLCNEAALHALQRDFNASCILSTDFERILDVQRSSLTQQQIDWYLTFKKIIQ